MRIFTLFYLFLFISSQLWGQPINYEKQLIQHNLGKSTDFVDMYLEDITGDDTKEIIYRSFSSIGYYERSKEHLIPNKEKVIVRGRSIASFTLSDFDGDNDLDLIFEKEDQYGWMENTDANGHFGDFQVLVDSVPIRDEFYLKDTDQDGDLDMLIHNYIDRRLEWRENLDGKGTFGLRNAIDIEGKGMRVNTFEDLDGDQDLDIICYVYQANEVIWFENVNGKGDFKLHSLIKNTPLIRDMVFVDMDMDGDKDLLGGGSQVLWYERDNDSNTYDKAHILDRDVSIWAIQVGDIDQDNDLDVIAGEIDEFVNIYENDSDRNRWYKDNILHTEAFASDFLITDLDEDGSKDLLIATSTYISWVKNDDGFFTELTPITIAPKHFNDFFFRDFDNDGFLDIILNSRYSSQFIGWYQNQQGTNFSPLQLLIDYNFINGWEARNTYCEDFNGDDFPDLVNIFYLDEKMTIHNGKEGALQRGNVIDQRIDFSFTINPVDVELDGDLDIMVSQTSSLGRRTIAYYENTNGLANFSSPKTVINNLATPAGLYLGDFTQDGYQDILLRTVDTSNAQLLLYLNETGGEFSQSPIVLMDSFPFDRFIHPRPFLKDINNDQVPDLFVHAESTLSIFKSIDGRLEYELQDQLSFTSPRDSQHLSFHDFENDGFPELIFTSNNQITRYENTDGQNLFSQGQQIFPEVVLPRSVYFEDMEFDGDIDIVFFTYGEEQLFYYENQQIVANKKLIVEPNFRLAPNPTHQNCTLLFDTPIQASSLYWQLYNAQGQSLSSGPIERSATTIDLHQFPNGPYCVRLLDKQANTVSSRWLIKQ